MSAFLHLKFPEPAHIVRLKPRVSPARRCGFVIAAGVVVYIAFQFVRLFGWIA